MSAVENRRLLAKVCEMYYLMDMSQKEIAARLNISRPQICRMIAQAREIGIVEIRIHNPLEKDTELERRLISRFPLEDAVVVGLEDAEAESREALFSREAARYLDSLLASGMDLGVMSGKTVSAVSMQMKGGGKHLGTVVPLVGGIGPASPDLHANAIALTIARKTHAVSLAMNAPLAVSSPEAAALFRQEPAIAQVLGKGKHCDICLVGTGNVDGRSTTAQAGGLSPQDLAGLREAGAVCSVCTSWFDENGREVGGLSARSIGLGLMDLKRSRVIAAARGKSKRQAIAAALKTGRISVLMTDAETARSLLSENSQTPDNE